LTERDNSVRNVTEFHIEMSGFSRNVITDRSKIYKSSRFQKLWCSFKYFLVEIFLKSCGAFKFLYKRRVACSSRGFWPCLIHIYQSTCCLFIRVGLTTYKQFLHSRRERGFSFFSNMSILTPFPSLPTSVHIGDSLPSTKRPGLQASTLHYIISKLIIAWATTSTVCKRLCCLRRKYHLYIYFLSSTRLLTVQLLWLQCTRIDGNLRDYDVIRGTIPTRQLKDWVQAENPSVKLLVTWLPKHDARYLSIYPTWKEDL
jgi:hypothetical protein